MLTTTQILPWALVALVAANTTCSRQPPASKNLRASTAPAAPAAPALPAQPPADPSNVPQPKWSLDLDYVAAVNEWASLGVTPQDNASVFFWQAVGSTSIEPELRKQYFEMLGIDTPADEQGNPDYFIHFQPFVEQQAAERHAADPNRQPNEADPDEPPPLKQLEQARQRAWTADEFPAVAEWLAPNERALTGVRSAAEHSRRYDPMIPPDGGTLDTALLHAAAMYGPCTLALVARANRSVAQGDLDEAWRDLITAHRLCRLVTQGQGVFEFFSGVHAEGSYACAGDQVLLQTGKLSAEQARRMLLDLDTLPETTSLADIIDHGERCRFGDWISKLAQQRLGFSAITNRDEPPGELSAADRIIAEQVDWNQVLRMGNDWYDIIADTCRPPTHRQRRLPILKLNRQIQEFEQEVAAIAAGEKVLTDPDHTPTENIGNTCILVLLPPVLTLDDHSRLSAMRFQLVRMGIALAACRAEQGAYPQQLDDLVPKYLSQIPDDFFAQPGTGLHYEPRDDGYLLWSVGENHVDNHGEFTPPSGEAISPDVSDDLALRVPAAPPEGD